MNSNYCRFTKQTHKKLQFQVNECIFDVYQWFIFFLVCLKNNSVNFFYFQPGFDRNPFGLEPTDLPNITA